MESYQLVVWRWIGREEVFPFREKGKENVLHPGALRLVALQFYGDPWCRAPNICM